MRVHERGSGETLSCGTGACAVAVAMAHGASADGPATYRVDVPGGTLEVAIDAAGEIVLSGPTDFVASGVIPELWLRHNGVAVDGVVPPVDLVTATGPETARHAAEGGRR